MVIPDPREYLPLWLFDLEAQEDEALAAALAETLEALLLDLSETHAAPE